MTSHFTFLQGEWPSMHEAAALAELSVHSDPRTACFYARRALEIAVAWLYKYDSRLRLPYQDNLSALIHEPRFRQVTGDAVFYKARAIKDLGNLAVHSHGPVRQYDAMMAVKELDAELVKLRAEVTAAKKANEAQPDTHNYSESETRDYFIDLLLKESGWPLDQERDREFPVTGMPKSDAGRADSGEGFVDYVLWGDDGKPLAIVEAKHTRKSSMIGQQQAKLYADCLEKQFGQRPVIFLTNGYEHWLWDDVNYPPREVQGSYRKDEMELLIHRRTTRKKLADAPINKATVERYYHERAIRRIGEAFENDNTRKSLLVMATGSGKTRLVIALTDSR